MPSPSPPPSPHKPPSPPFSHTYTHAEEWHGGGRDAGRPNRILFVEDLTALVSDSLPDFWKLGQAYFSSSLFQVCVCEVEVRYMG